VEAFAGVPAASAPSEVTGPAWHAAPAVVRALLKGAADPVRTLVLVQSWLDATPLGVVLTGTDADLTTLVANMAFRDLVPPERLPVEGHPWRELAPDGDDGRLVAAAKEVIRSARCQSVMGFRPPWTDYSSSPPRVWDVELCPVTEAAGSVTHLLLTVHDVTMEVAAGHRLEALARCSAELHEAPDAPRVLAASARHAQALLANSGSLVVARGREPGGVDVVAATGVWARAEQGAERELPMALIREVLRTGTPLEIERAGPVDTIEALRVVPLLSGPGTANAEVLGALSYSRLGRDSFSPADRVLMEELAGRVGVALTRVERLRAEAGSDTARGA
jgi:hypothetical protein